MKYYHRQFEKAKSAKATVEYIERSTRSENANIIMLSDMQRTNRIDDQWRNKTSTKDLLKPNHGGNPSGKETRKKC